MKLSEKQFNQLVEFISGFLINLFVFTIAVFLTEITFLLALLYSTINAFLMVIFLFPILKKASDIIKKRKRKYQLKPLEDYYQDQIKRRLQLEKEFQELERKEEKLLEKYKYDWKLYHKYLKRKNIECVYHFTDRENLNSILDNGGLYSLKACSKNGISVSRPGGNQLSHELDRKANLDNYIRLSFTPNHPMMYYAIGDGRINNPVILKINREVIYWLDSKYSNDNATNKSAKIGADFQSLPLDKIKRIQNIDYFDSPEEFKKFYQAEILVKERIPLKYIENIYEYIE